MTRHDECQGRRETIAAAVLGELDPAAAAELAEHLSRCDSCRRLHEALSAEEREIRSAFDAVATRSDALPARPRRSNGRWPVRSKAALAAAAVIIVALVIPLLTPHGPRGPGAPVAWAEVLETVDGVEQVQITALIREGGKDFALDLYYRRPGTWRAQGMGVIQFASDGKSRFFHTASGQFVEPKDCSFRPLPDEFIRAAGEKDLLHAILKLLFRGKAPAGEPVRTSAEALGPGVEVFDYANDPAQLWARIWVLKASRLPLRVKLHQPAAGDWALGVFDYTDPQPAEFFDPDRFAQAAAELSPRRPGDYYAVGMAPLGGKPRTARDIHRLYGYRPPKLIRIEANDLGDLLIVSADPENRTPTGGHVKGTYERTLRDNWGNRYIQCGAFMPVRPRHWSQFYMPLAPIKTGSGPHRIILKYTAADPKTGRPIALLEEPVDIPAPTVTGSPGKWGQYCTPGSKRVAIRNHYRYEAWLEEQLAIIDKWLKDDPQSDLAILWKMDLMIEHEQKAEAYALFERTIRDTLIAEPFRSYDRDRTLANYLFHLLDTGRGGEVAGMVKGIEEGKRRALDSKDRNLVHTVQHQSDPRQGLWMGLPSAMEIPAALAAFERGPKPTVQRVVASKDGYVLVEYVLPETGGPTEAPLLWTDGRWGRVAGMATIKVHSKFPRHFLLWAGGGTEVTLEFHPGLIPSKNKGAAPTRFTWRLTAPIPAQRVETMRAWLAENLPEMSWPDVSAHSFLLRQADEHFHFGDYGHALALYRRIQAIPDKDWPEFYHHPANGDLLERTRARIAVAILRCRIRIEPVEAVAAELDEMEREAPAPKADLQDWAALNAQAGWRDIRLDGVRRLIDEGRLDAADDLLKRIERDRPDLTAIDPQLMTLAVPGGGPSPRPVRHAVRTLWRPVDSVRWQLRRARRSEPPSRTGSSQGRTEDGR
ncbi:MAG TPA: hypothetical protein VFJ30_05155 [Phycisphaerae bacterium]|nr:hypothetical protein [Phycisphaerae bacterium]